MAQDTWGTCGEAGTEGSLCINRGVQPKRVNHNLAHPAVSRHPKCSSMKRPSRPLTVEQEEAVQLYAWPWGEGDDDTQPVFYIFLLSHFFSSHDSQFSPCLPSSAQLPIASIKWFGFFSSAIPTILRTPMWRHFFLVLQIPLLNWPFLRDKAKERAAAICSCNNIAMKELGNGTLLSWAGF